jgi:hypothetical protein
MQPNGTKMQSFWHESWHDTFISRKTAERLVGGRGFEKRYWGR